MFKTAVLAASIATLAPLAHAEVTGAFVFQGTEVGAFFDGAFNSFTFDTYTFDVTNNTSNTITAFGIDASNPISFFGNFLQAGGNATNAAPSLEADVFAAFVNPPGVALEDDTFFIGSGTLLFADTVDSDTELSASLAGSSGLSILPGETESIAFFAVPEGETPTGGLGAPAVFEDGSFELIVPEPASIALLASGLSLAGLRRRSS